jgi:hypothetical protein
MRLIAMAVMQTLPCHASVAQLLLLNGVLVELHQNSFQSCLLLCAVIVNISPSPTYHDGRLAALLAACMLTADASSM